jgi:hypothetical protein
LCGLRKYIKKKGEGSNMSVEKIYIFKKGSLWCFKYFFDDREIFNELADYYNGDRFRFELKSIEVRDNVMTYLKEKGFEPVPIIDACEYGRS